MVEGAHFNSCPTQVQLIIQRVRSIFQKYINSAVASTVISAKVRLFKHWRGIFNLNTKLNDFAFHAFFKYTCLATVKATGFIY